RGAEAVNLGGRHRRNGLADQLGRLRPARAKRQCDVVLLNTCGVGELFGCNACDGERVDVRAVERMLVLHLLTVWGAPDERGEAASAPQMRDNQDMPFEFERTQRIAILGGGPGGYEAALTGAQLGA